MLVSIARLRTAESKQSKCYVTGMVDGKPVMWACEMDDAEVLPAESE